MERCSNTVMKIYYFGCQIDFNRELTCIIGINPLKLMALGERKIYWMRPFHELYLSLWMHHIFRTGSCSLQFDM